MKQTHVGQTVLFYAAKGNAIGTDEQVAVITRAWSLTCVNLEIIAGTFRGCEFQSVDNIAGADPDNAMWCTLDAIDLEIVPEPTRAASDAGYGSDDLQRPFNE